MAELIRRPEPMQSSPRSSPRDRGSRSPAYPRQDSSGTLKTTISLVPGKTPSVIHTGSFYLVKDIPDEAEITGSTNLLNYYNLEHSYNRFLNKKVKEELSAFLPHLPGNIDSPGIQDNSSLRSLIEKIPTNKEMNQLSGSALSGFRLHPGPLPEQYQTMNQMTQKKKKHKKKNKDTDKGSALQLAPTDTVTGEQEPKPPAKRPKTRDDNKEGKKKKKKDKEKKKKKKHSPEATAANGAEATA